MFVRLWILRNYFKLIIIDLSRQTELDADPKVKQIKQIKFVGQLKNINGINADETQNMFVLRIFEKTLKETRLKFSQESDK